MQYPTFRVHLLRSGSYKRAARPLHFLSCNENRVTQERTFFSPHPFADSKVTYPTRFAPHDPVGASLSDTFKSGRDFPPGVRKLIELGRLARLLPLPKAVGVPAVLWRHKT